jgi:hypothetical protein
MISDRATLTLVHFFLLGGIAIGEGTSGGVLMVFVLLLQEIDHYSGTFLLCSSSFLLVVCMLNVIRALGYCRG